MNIELQINEIIKKSETFHLDPSTKAALELSKTLKEQGLLAPQTYNIRAVDTVGRERALTRHVNFMNLSKK